MTPFQIYLISQADNFERAVFVGILISVGVIVIFSRIIADYGYNEYQTSIFKKVIKISIFFFISFIMMFMFSPSTKTLIAMYTLPSIVNNKEAQKLPINLVNFANSWLEKNTDKMK